MLKIAAPPTATTEPNTIRTQMQTGAQLVITRTQPKSKNQTAERRSFIANSNAFVHESTAVYRQTEPFQ